MPNVALTYGCELEVVKLSPNAGSIIQANNFDQHHDASIQPSSEASEIISRPAPLTFNPESAKCSFDLRVLENLSKCAEKVNKTCGFHLHVKPQHGNWTPEQSSTFLTACILIEEQIFTLVPNSRRSNRFCLRIANAFKGEELENTDFLGQVSSRKYSNDKRYCWLNLTETKRPGGHGTIEIRLLGSVKRISYIEAWCSLWFIIAGTILAYDSGTAIRRIMTGQHVKAAMITCQTAKAQAIRNRTQTEVGAEPLPTLGILQTQTSTDPSDVVQGQDLSAAAVNSEVNSDPSGIMPPPYSCTFPAN